VAAALLDPRGTGRSLPSTAWATQWQSIERSNQGVGVYADLKRSASDREKQKVAQETLKANLEKMKHDAQELGDLAKGLQEELAKSDEKVLSLTILEKAEKIEKLAKSIKKTARAF
jgi:hypothetical protein